MTFWPIQTKCEVEMGFSACNCRSHCARSGKVHMHILLRVHERRRSALCECFLVTYVLKGNSSVCMYSMTMYRDLHGADSAGIHRSFNNLIIVLFHFIHYMLFVINDGGQPGQWAPPPQDTTGQSRFPGWAHTVYVCGCAGRSHTYLATPPVALLTLHWTKMADFEELSDEDKVILYKCIYWLLYHHEPLS